MINYKASSKVKTMITTASMIAGAIFSINAQIEDFTKKGPD